MSNKMVAPFLIAFVFFISACNDKNGQTKSTGDEEWISLFNGKDLTGWEVKITNHPFNENYKNTFRVEDSMIRVVYSDYGKFDGQFGHLYSQSPYSYYKLKLQYRFVGDHLADAPAWAR